MGKGEKDWSQELRDRATRRLDASGTEVSEMSTEQLHTLIYELQVHQEELRISNEELRNAHEALAKARDRYEDLFEFAPVGYITLDDRLIIIRVNTTAATMLDIPADRFPGTPMTMITGPGNRDSLHVFLRNVGYGKQRTGDFVFSKEDGTALPVQLVASRLSGSPEIPEKYRIAFSDASERTRLQRELQHRADELTAANKELESFSYSVSHDLKAPLRYVQSFSDMLREDHGDRLGDTGTMYLDRLCASAKRMSELIDDMLQLSRISRQELHRIELNLQALASGVIDNLRQHEPNRPIEVEISPLLPTSGDPRMLRLALDNLIRNAWKYTSKTENPRITIGTTRMEDRRVFYIQDNGVGFDMRKSDDLFLPFRRLHSAREFEGSGIGLAVVKRVIEKHGGKIWAKSEPGKGATFYFTLG